MIRSIYLYAVSIITLVMAITGGAMLFNAAADYVAPSVYTQSYNEYVMYSKSNSQNDATEDELREDYEEYKQDEQERVRNNAINQFISSIGLIVISLPVFFFYQRKISRERHELKDHPVSKV